MRGRTLNTAFIILDEAQNTPAEKMKLFLTRLGYESKAFVTLYQGGCGKIPTCFQHHRCL